MEGQLQQECETSREQMSSLEDQLQTEKRHRDDAEIEVNKQKQVCITITVDLLAHVVDFPLTLFT